jgi:hypothetical protein
MGVGRRRDRRSSAVLSARAAAPGKARQVTYMGVWRADHCWRPETPTGVPICHVRWQRKGDSLATASALNSHAVGSSVMGKRPTGGHPLSKRTCRICRGKSESCSQVCAVLSDRGDARRRCRKSSRSRERAGALALWPGIRRGGRSRMSQIRCLSCCTRATIHVATDAVTAPTRPMPTTIRATAMRRPSVVTG